MDWRELLSRPWVGEIIGFIVGGFPIWWPMLNGYTLFNALFAFAYSTIAFGFAARALVGWIALFAILLIGISAWTGYSLRERPEGRWFRWFTCFVIGWALARSLAFILLDQAFFLGAILTLPFVLGSLMLAAISGHVLAHPLLTQGREVVLRSAKASASHALIIFLVGMLLFLPNLTAMAGLQPSPPERPQSGYGSGEFPFEVAELVYDPVFPENVTSWYDEQSESKDWRVYVFSPKDVGERIVGVALLLHGYEGEDMEVYRDTLESLAGQGLVAIFPQYVSDVDMSSIDSGFELTYLLGGSDHPQHQPRYTMALYGIDHAWERIEAGDQVQEALGGEATIDPGHLWIGGHSMGAGTTYHVLSEVLGRGWGSQSLVVDLEAPWIHATQSEFQGNMSRLPDHAIIQIIEYESDNVVAKCIGRWQHARLLARDGAGPLSADQVQFLQVPSDYRGFPRLIASHYLPATLIRESLADHSYYPRLEAQADFIASSASGDAAAAQTAQAAFMESTDLGEWSNGDTVYPMVFVDAPLELPDDDIDACPVT